MIQLVVILAPTAGVWAALLYLGRETGEYAKITAVFDKWRALVAK